MTRLFRAAGAAALLCAVLWQPGMAGVSAQPALTPEERYASPLELLLSPDGARLYVLCQSADEVRVLNAATGRVLQTIPVGHLPRGFSFSPDGRRLYVTNSWDDTVTVIVTYSGHVEATWAAGFEPSSAVANRTGQLLYVADRIGNDITVLDAATGETRTALVAGRGASYLALSADGSRLYATHVYPNATAHRTPPKSEITVIDPAKARVVDRMTLPDIAGVFHVALSGDGRLGVAAQLHPKNLVPLAHVEHGWAFVDTLTVFGADVDSKPVEVPLDELDRYYAMPFGVVIAPDKSRIYVSHGASECVTVIDTRKMLSYVRRHPEGLAENLAASANYVVARIPVGKNPRGLVLSRDGTRLYVANRLDDSISVIDTRWNRVVRTIRLSGPKTITPLRRGEQTFYHAYAFQGQFSCSNCHIDSTFDGLQWDLEPDGFGVDIVDNRLIEDLRGTEPFKWNGGNPTLVKECGIRTEMYFWRSQNYDDLRLTDLVLYIRSLPSRPNRWRAANGELTPAQERGRAIFNRTLDKLGQAIPEANRCSYCHSGPKGTSQKSFDVGTGKSTDNSGVLDTPQLMNVALTAPYLHDGSAQSLEEIWTVYNPHDQHGRTNDLTKDELNDLIEYLRTR